MEFSCGWLPCRMKNISYVNLNQISFWGWVCFETLSFHLSSIGWLPLALMSTAAATVSESQRWSVSSIPLCGSAAWDSLCSWVGRRTKRWRHTYKPLVDIFSCLLIRYWNNRHVHTLIAFHLSFTVLSRFIFSSSSCFFFFPFYSPFLSVSFPFLSFPFIISPDSFFSPLLHLVSPLIHSFFFSCTSSSGCSYKINGGLIPWSNLLCSTPTPIFTRA